MENNWTEIRKECELDTNGDYLIKKVVLEKSSPNKTKIERKVMIDYAIRIIGIISIFMPLFLFYKQQQAEGQKQDRLQRLNLYSTAIVDLHSFSKEKPFSQSYEIQSDKILFESYPKIIFLNDKPITEQFTEVKLIIEYTNFLNEIFKKSIETDSLVQYFSSVDSLNFLKYDNKFEASGLKVDFNFFINQKGNLLNFSLSEKSKKISFLDQSTKKIDSFINETIDVIYYLQNKNLRDSILESGDIFFFINPVLSRSINIDEYKNEYKIFFTDKIRVIDSLMIQSTKKKL